MCPQRWGRVLRRDFQAAALPLAITTMTATVDALILNMNDLPSLLRNDGGNKQNWIKLKLVGTKCNRTAIGARVRVTTGKQTQMDEVHSGDSVMSQSDLRLHFGVGGATTIDRIEVKWPTTQKLEIFKAGEVQSDFDYPRGRRDHQFL